MLSPFALLRFLPFRHRLPSTNITKTKSCNFQFSHKLRLTNNVDFLLLWCWWGPWYCCHSWSWTCSAARRTKSRIIEQSVAFQVISLCNGTSRASFDPLLACTVRSFVSVVCIISSCGLAVSILDSASGRPLAGASVAGMRQCPHPVSPPISFLVSVPVYYLPSPFAVYQPLFFDDKEGDSITRRRLPIEQTTIARNWETLNNPW